MDGRTPVDEVALEELKYPHSPLQ